MAEHRFISGRTNVVADALPGCLRFTCVALFVAITSLNAQAGGGSFGDPDEHAPDEGPGYFGFVKDERGTPVRDAKVTASYKTSLSFVTRSNAIGGYRVRGFKKDINPNDVTISCAKDGYKQLRVFRRAFTRGKPIKSVETECRLQKL